MIAERLQCKLNRQFRDADEIQAQLMAENVFVDDGRKEWRADGQQQQQQQQKRQQTNRNDRFGKNKKEWSPSELSMVTEDEDEIIRLIEERSQCKMERNYDRADDIRDELLEVYNVKVDDKIRMWSVGGRFPSQKSSKRFLANFVMSKNSPIPENTEEIRLLVDDRDKAHLDRNNKRWMPFVINCMIWGFIFMKNVVNGPWALYMHSVSISIHCRNTIWIPKQNRWLWICWINDLNTNGTGTMTMRI